MNLDDALQTFIAESRELLEDMENALLNIEHQGDPGEAVNAIFRAAHTIKGSAGLFSLDHIVAFTHVVESVLDEVRDGKIEIKDNLVVLLLSCCDHIASLVHALESHGSAPDPDLETAAIPLVEQLRRYLGAGGGHGGAHAVVLAEQEAKVERINESGAGGDGETDHWHISLRFGRGVLQDGMDPISFLRYLQRIGRIVRIATIPDAMPAAAEMDAELCYLGFEIAFQTDANKETIEGVFEFVHDSCELRLIPPHSQVDEFMRLIAALPEESQRLGEILRYCGSLTQRELDIALNAQSETDIHPAPPLGTLLVEQANVPPVVVEAALAKQKQVSEQKAQESRSIRVDAEKLDHLINLVGELIIAGARTNMIGHRLHNLELQECTSVLSTLVEDVRDAALELRMVKIGATFNRFQRVVHDVARELGKDIVLNVNGEDTELDKTVVEKIGDPLTHLVRNAMDHGIEAADVRVSRGKPARGTVTLNAFHDSGSIVIEVKDDGGGLKKERILAKAVERGLVEAERKMTDQEIYALIFEPGFSTAEAITNLSGRGVGMDVVKRNITALRGSVTIDSEEGAGTTVSVRLPLTLAIIDGFQVQLGSSIYVVPLDVIEECIEFSAEDGHDYTNLRGQVLPFIRLRELFGITAPKSRRESIVVIRFGGQRAGLVVDALLGEFQTVIKPMGPIFAEVKCISGSTILGSGEVALIVDVAAMFKAIADKHHPSQLAA